MKHLIYARCFAHHVEDVKHVSFGKKQVGNVSARNQHDVQERSGVVVLVEPDFLGKVRRKRKSLFPLSMNMMNSNISEICQTLARMYESNLLSEPRRTSASAALFVRFVFMTLRSLLTNGTNFALVSLKSKRGVH